MYVGKSRVPRPLMPVDAHYNKAVRDQHALSGGFLFWCCRSMRSDSACLLRMRSLRQRSKLLFQLTLSIVRCGQFELGPSRLESGRLMSRPLGPSSINTHFTSAVHGSLFTLCCSPMYFTPAVCGSLSTLCIC